MEKLHSSKVTSMSSNLIGITMFNYKLMSMRILFIFLLILTLSYNIVEMKVVGNKVSKRVEKENPKSLIVTATTYTVDKDDTIQSFTASGFKINEENPGEHRIIAISWDLRKMFKFGEKVLVEGIGKYSGIYTVRDLMASRWKNRIDILRNPEDLLITYHKVKVSKIK